MKKFFITLVIVSPLLLFGFILIYLSSLNEEDIQPYLSDALGPEYTIELQSASISPFSRQLGLGEIRVSSTREDRLIFEADTLTLSGLGLMAFFRDRLAITNVKLDSFTLDWDTDQPDQEGESDGQDPAIDRVSIGTLDLSKGTIILRERGEISSRINGFNILAGFDFHLKSLAEPSAYRDNSIRIDSVGFTYSEGKYAFSLSGLRYEQQRGRLSLSGMQVTPLYDFEEFMALLPYRKDMIDLDVQNVLISGLDVLSFLDLNTIKTDTIDIDLFSIHISTDTQIKKSPGTGEAKLLNQMVQNLPYELQLKAMDIEKANVSYSERSQDGVRPGTISFMNSTVRIQDVDTRSGEPAVLNAVTYLQNHSQLNTRLRFTLNDGPFKMTGSGNLGEFDMLQLNSIFKDLVGIEITDGTTFELEFDFEMLENRTLGNMRVIYEDFKIQTISKDDHDSGFTDRITAFLANEVVLRSHNMPNSSGEVREGIIKHERNPAEDPFFKYLWESLRSGLFDIMIRI